MLWSLLNSHCPVAITSNHIINLASVTIINSVTISNCKDISHILRGLSLDSLKWLCNKSRIIHNKIIILNYFNSVIIFFCAKDIIMQILCKNMDYTYKLFLSLFYNFLIKTNNKLQVYCLTFQPTFFMHTNQNDNHESSLSYQ